jgi:peptidyl-prolyl cis-trans isomerase SurA
MTTAARILSWSALICALAFAASASAQALRSSNSLAPAQAMAQDPVDARTVDYIVALVNSEPVTNNEVRQRLLRVEQEMAQQGVVMPPRDELARQVMELLVSERAQLQAAAEQGLRADDASLEQAEQNIALQNQLGLEEFRRQLAAQGTDLNRFRNELRNQLLLRKVRERETERVRVSNAEIESRIQELNARNPERAETLLGHVLVKVPEPLDPDAMRALHAKAQSIADRARAGEDFGALARAFSEAPEAANGGAFGWRTAAQLPTLFVQATDSVPAGGVAGPLRSPAGWHVLKVIERRQGAAPELMLLQSHVSHILLRPNAQLSQDGALGQLAGLRDQVVKGQASFDALARQFSQDGSASQGGDLGWVTPGQFVPEFEAVMDSLKPGELSQPMVSRFGAHLIRLEDRREVAMSPEQQREAVRNVLREKKVEENLQTWTQDVRARAYVEFRELPRP